MNQTLNPKKPDLEAQIAFIRGARHLAAKGHTVQHDETTVEMLMAIEENLCAVKLLEAHD